MKKLLALVFVFLLAAIDVHAELKAVVAPNAGSLTGTVDISNAGTAINGTPTLIYPLDTITYASMGLGYGALAYQTAAGSAAYNNTAVGYLSLGSSSFSSSALNNTAVGYLTGSSVTTGFNNVLVGWKAGSSLTTGHWNDCIGHDACEHLTTGIQETAVGEGALFNDTSGGQVAVGFDAMLANTTGVNNTALGANTLGNNLSGQNNTAVGNSALLHALGSSDTAVGAGADQAETGSSETAIGYNALTLANGGNNTALGNGAGSSITSGQNNLILGLNAASATLTTGSKNILIGGFNGGGLDTPLSGTSNFLNIGNTIFATSTNTGTLASPAGNVGIGTVSPISVLAINGVATYYGTAPTCGTGCSSITSGSNNARGSMVSNSSVSAVTLTFASSGAGTWMTTPVCVISDSNSTAVADISAVSTTILTVSLASALSAVTIYWHCEQ